MNFLKIAFLLACATALTGCDSATTTSQSASPSGFTRIADGGSAPVGATVYTSDGAVFGTVAAYDNRHKFPDGDTGLAVSIQPSDNGDVVWMTSLNFQNAYYVKN